jgi:hypothetical protein
MNPDIAKVINTTQWFMVLASPPLYQTLARTADPEHLVRLTDVWIAYAERGDCYHHAEFAPVPYEQRVPLARSLRSLLAAWSPPDLSPAITEAARAVLHAEGLKAPDMGGWDALKIDSEDPLADILLWPEGVPALLRRAAQGRR